MFPHHFGIVAYPIQAFPQFLPSFLSLAFGLLPKKPSWNQSAIMSNLHLWDGQKPITTKLCICFGGKPTTYFEWFEVHMKVFCSCVLARMSSCRREDSLGWGKTFPLFFSSVQILCTARAIFNLEISTIGKHDNRRCLFGKCSKLFWLQYRKQFWPSLCANVYFE